MREVEWCAGLFCGEGCVGVSVSHKSQGDYSYLSLQIGMYDERSIRRFAKTFGVPYTTFFLPKQKHVFYKVMVRGRTAERILALLWPHIKETDKGDQTLRHAKFLGVEKWLIGKQQVPFV